jgi:hypothetical protein
MKIILSESQILNLLNEDMGVSRSTLPYVNLIYRIIEPMVESMVHSGKSSRQNIVIGLDKIKSIIKNDEDSFLEFPMEEIEIVISFSYEKGDVENHFASGGAAYALDEKTGDYSYMRKPSPEIPKKIKDEVEMTLNALMDIEIYIDSKFKMSQMDELLMDVRDTIMHETLHLYEFYKRWLSTGSGNFNVSKTYAGRKNPNTPREIYDYYSEFLDYVYYSEPYEINAMTQEAYSKVLRMSFDTFKTTKYWIMSNKMENFNADQYYRELEKKIKERSGEETLNYHLNNLHKFYLKQYVKISLENNESVSNKILKTKNVYDLIKSFELRITQSGKNLKRKFMKLYTIER